MIESATQPPPPPPPPEEQTTPTQTNTMISSCLSTIVTYPQLLQHEEALSTSQTATTGGSLGAYDVTKWITYLQSIDDVLDILKDGLHSLTNNQKNKKKVDVSKTTTIQAGGTTFHISSAKAPGITHTPLQFNIELNKLVQARILVGERSVSLLPGSYKLWKNHLLFKTSLLESSSSRGSSNNNNKLITEELTQKSNQLRFPPYLLTSSSQYNHYNSTKSAYERSLVRLHKSPSIWLHYAAFVALYNPNCDSSTVVRHIYDRALIALPASQHERIWEDYLCWVTGILPSKSGDKNNGKDNDWTNISRKGIHNVKYGFESPLVAQWRKNGWGYNQIESMKFDKENNTNNKGSKNNNKMSMEYQSTVPTETALRILRRYANCFDITYREDLATLCITRYGRYGEGASLLLSLLNNNGQYMSPNGTTRHELWLRFADVCTGHPNEAKVAGVDFDGIVRAVLKGQDVVGGGGGDSGGGSGGTLGFKVFDNSSKDDEQQQTNNKSITTTPQVLNHRLGEMEGTLWTRLAEYHVRAGDFELARSVYEEALDAITRVRDFSLVFDAYVKFEEGVIEALMELMEEEEDEEEDEDEETTAAVAAADNEDMDILLGDNTVNSYSNNDEGNNDTGGGGASADVELAISRAEHLTSRRPLLLNRVLLRQNPHNVGEWIKRSQLYLDLNEVNMAVTALEESLKSVSANKSVNGSPSTLVLTLVDIHENRQKDVNAARKILERVCTNSEYDFQDSDDLAQCHAAWVELELRQEDWDMALNLARRSVSGKVGKKSSKATRGLSRSLRLWNLLFDLEESLGTVQTTKDAYDRALELKVATPSHVLNYATFLKDKKYFEESFAAYERGLGLFPFPHAGAVLLWKNYLTNFLERYEGSKTPRVRELFDRCLTDCPPEESPEFYLMYGDYEENHGLTKRALGVYERMSNAVPPSEKYTAYRLYIAKAIQYLGVTSARPIYEAAISALEDGPSARICLEYAKMETGLRESDRARAVLVYGAQLADPRRDPDYWKAWHEFEVSHGNEETFREMLRVKRSVQAAFSTVNYNAEQMGATPQVETLTDDQAMEMIAEREGMTVDKPLVGGFVQGTKKRKADTDLDDLEQRATKLREAVGDEIDLDDLEEEEEEPEASTTPPPSSTKNVSMKAVPAAVLGGLTSSGDSK